MHVHEWRSQVEVGMPGAAEPVLKQVHRLCFPKERLLGLEQRKMGVPQPDECILGGSNTLEGGESPPEFPLGPTSAFPDPGLPSASQLATSPGRDLGLRVCVCGQLCRHQQGVSLSMSESVCN